MSRQLDSAVEAAYSAYAAGDVARADASCAEILRKAPRNDRALHLLGRIRLESGDAAGAAALLEKAAKARPADDGLLEDLGVAQLVSGGYAAAERTLSRALKLARTPRASLHARLAHALGALARPEEAEAALRAALALDPANAGLHLALGRMLAERGLWNDARECFADASRLEPDRAEPLFNLAVLLEREGRDEDAARAYGELTGRFPGEHDAWINRGVVQERLDRNAEAIASYGRALEIEPDSVHALANLGKVLRAERRLDEAKAACLHALRIDPASTDARMNLAAVLAEEGDAQGARVEYDKALERDPQSPDTHYSAAALALAVGDYDRGWREYAWRPTRLRARASGLALDAALPADVRDRDVVVLGEQGLGDELFFLRYARELAGKGARVHVQCDARLAPLVERTGAFQAVLTPDAPVPPADVTVVAGDLPLLLADRGVPAQPAPLVLVALEARKEALATRLAALGDPPYVGLTWRAGTPPALQHSRHDRALYKAVPFDVLAQALERVRGTIIALQRQPEAGEIAQLAARLGREVHDFTSVNDDLEEMLALLAVLDEYVGVSNTNMHLKAGLRGGARVLVPNPPEWRWMWSGERSSWFPASRVYRESHAEGWAAAARTLAHDLAAGAAGNKG